jgi:hypothetical protein
LEWLASFGGSLVLDDIPLWAVAAFYLLLALVTVKSSYLQKARQWLKPGVLLTALALLVGFVW